MTAYLVAVPAAYLLGALPFGLVVGWLFKGIDVRRYGSGSMGTTNVQRTVGTPAAVLVLALDMGKGALAVWLARALWGTPGVTAAAGLAALVGHSWPVYIGFRGGRGVATGWAVLLTLSPISGLVATAVGIPLVAATRYVSLGSIVSAVVGAGVLTGLALTGREPLPYMAFALPGATLVLWRHRENMGRLLRGQERKLGQRVEASETPPSRRRRRGLRWPRSA